jgi:hypothetical protein
VLDDSAVDDVLVGGLGGFGALLVYCCGADERLKDVLLVDVSALSGNNRSIVVDGRSNK